jgi:hypothetical protein
MYYTTSTPHLHHCFILFYSFQVAKLSHPGAINNVSSAVALRPNPVNQRARISSLWVVIERTRSAPQTETAFLKSIAAERHHAGNKASN